MSDLLRGNWWERSAFGSSTVTCANDGWEDLDGDLELFLAYYYSKYYSIVEVLQYRRTIKNITVSSKANNDYKYNSIVVSSKANNDYKYNSIVERLKILQI
jgi:hypothetical protein